MTRRRYSRRTQILKSGSPRRISPAVKLEVCERDGWVCKWCGKVVNRDPRVRWGLAPSMDHEPPLSCGHGSNWPKDLQLTHRTCNFRKWAN
jgi:5-methylcytosine-specific restriction endonuclease McrA